MADYSKMTDEEFREILGEIVEEEGANILSIGGVYTELAEHYNNAVLDRWEEKSSDMYAIWSEGYAATGERGGAVYHGEAQGTSFKDACINYFKDNDPKGLFDPDRMTFWGCGLFRTEREARKSFG